MRGACAGDAFDRDALTLAEQSAGIGVWSIDLTANRLARDGAVLPHHGPRADQRHASRSTRAGAAPSRTIASASSQVSARAESGGDTYEIEYRIIRPDGNVRWIFGRGRVIRDADGRPIRYSGVDLDITERKAAEEALEAAKQELERMNQVLEQRVRDRTAELEAEAARRPRPRRDCIRRRRWRPSAS